MTTPSISDLSALREVAEKATPGPWDVWREPCADKYEAANELSEQAHLTDGFAGAVFLLNANGKCPASTGCGPTSEANAAFIAAANPQTVLALLDHLASEKARADAAEAERERLRTAYVDAVKLIGVERGERDATIASLTEQLAEAREATRQMHRRAQQAERVTEIGKGILKMWLEYFRSCKTPRKERFLFIYALREIDRRLSRLEKQEGEA